MFDRKSLERSDVDLMALTRKGDRDAFSALVRRHQQSLMNFFRRLGVYNDAEDMVQETFVRLFRYRDNYKPEAKFTTFLFLLARQVRIDSLRKDRRRDETAKQYEAEAVASAAEEYDELRGLGADVEECMMALPETLREVVVLSIYQGMRYAEISELLEIPVGTVKSRVFTAMHRMREDLNARLESDD